MRTFTPCSGGRQHPRRPVRLDGQNAGSPTRPQSPGPRRLDSQSKPGAVWFELSFGRVRGPFCRSSPPFWWKTHPATECQAGCAKVQRLARPDLRVHAPDHIPPRRGRSRCSPWGVRGQIRVLGPYRRQGERRHATTVDTPKAGRAGHQPRTPASRTLPRRTRAPSRNCRPRG